jgi:hypothetical protein
MGVLLGSRVLDTIRGDIRATMTAAPSADHVGGALLTSGASGHGCFLAVKPNQPEDDGEYGVPDMALPNVALPNVALPNVALPIARGPPKNPQYARPLVCGHEREANGTKQDKRGDHRQTFSSLPTMPHQRPFQWLTSTIVYIPHDKPIRHSRLKVPDHRRLGPWDWDRQRLACGGPELDM